MRRVQHTVGLVAPNYVQSSLRSTFALWASDPYGPDDDDDDDDDDDEGDDDDDDDEDPPPEPCIGDEPDECAPVV